MQRKGSAEDRRGRLLSLTEDGQNLLQAIEPDVQKAQERILEPLPAAERDAFMCMLRKLVAANNELSRAPSEA
jgi:DNA-binding MarR family transcriptional regulator